MLDLLTTSMMSAPGSMAVAKLIQPETEISCFRNKNRDFLTKSKHRNVFDALMVIQYRKKFYKYFSMAPGTASICV